MSKRGGKRKGAGRPSKDNALTEGINVSVDTKTKQAYKMLPVEVKRQIGERLRSILIKYLYN
jgi:predicted transcriptional regulator